MEKINIPRYDTHHFNSVQTPTKKKITKIIFILYYLTYIINK